MWPPSIPISAAIFFSAAARRMSAAVVASTRSFGCVRTASCTLSMSCSARFTAIGPVTSLGTQIEKNSASSPPSRIRGMSMLPFGMAGRRDRSVLSKSIRCVVSSWESTTMARAWTSAGAVAPQQRLVRAAWSPREVAPHTQRYTGRRGRAAEGASA